MSTISEIKQSTVRRAAIALLTFFSVNFSNCDSKALRPLPNNLCVQLTYNLPIIDFIGKFVNYTDSLSILYQDSFVLYRIPYTHSTTEVLTNEKDSVIEEPRIREELRYEYFIFKKGDQYGYRYDSFAAKQYQKRLVDSFLAVKSFTTVKLFDLSNDSLISSKKLNDEIQETYIPKIKVDSTYCDTSYYYFTSKMPRTILSLSKELDSLKDMKLYKARLLYNSSGTLPKREIYFELKPLSAKATNDLLKQFFKLKKELF
jgi:hypothetical protein